MKSRTRLSTTIFTLSTLLAIASSDHHLATVKSCDRAHVECRQYLQLTGPRNGDPEMHCALILVRGWDDSTGSVYSVYRRFWRNQTPGDTCYEHRTAKCLDKSRADKSPIWRAARSRDCFNDQYGQINATLLEFLRPQELRFRQVVRDCVDVLQLTEGELVQTISEGDWLDSRPLSCLLRCAAIRSGLYTDGEGPRTERLELVYGARSVQEDRFQQRVEKCTARVKTRYSTVDKCSVAAHILDECLDDFLQDLFGAISELTLC